MKIINPGIEATDTHNLNGFFGLLYKIDLRNKRQERASSKESEKNNAPQTKIEGVKNNDK